MKHTLRNILSSAVLATALVGFNANAQIITNPNYDLTVGPTPLPTDFTVFGNADANGWGVVTSTAYWIANESASFGAPSESGPAFVGITNNTLSGPSASGIFTSISDLTIGEEYTISLYIRARDNASEGGTLAGDISGGTSAPLFAGISASSSEWTLIDGSFTAASTTAQLGFQFLSSSGDQTMFVDNVTISPVPEPAALISILGGCAILLAGRRRSRHLRN